MSSSVHQIDSTSKISFDNHKKNWSGVEAHVKRKHKPGHYSNKNIDLTKDGQNFSGYIHDYDKLCRKYYNLFLIIHNFRAKSTGHKTYKNYQDFMSSNVNSSNRDNNQRNAVFEIGNKDVRKKYYHVLHKKGFDDKHIREIEKRALLRFTLLYEEESYQSIGALVVNLDESTAHIHCQDIATPPVEKIRVTRGKHKGETIKPKNLTPRGKKWKRKLKSALLKTGKISEKKADALSKNIYVYKPTASFNQALYSEFPDAKNKAGDFDSRKCLSELNHKYGKQIIVAFNTELRKAGVKDFKLNYVRTGKVNDLTEKGYESSMEAKRQSSNLARVNSSVAKAKSSANSELTSIKSKVSEAYNVINHASSASSITSATESMAKSQWSSLPSSIQSKAIEADEMNYLADQDNPLELAKFQSSAVNSYNSSKADSMSSASASMASEKKLLRKQYNYVNKINQDYRKFMYNCLIDLGSTDPKRMANSKNPMKYINQGIQFCINNNEQAKAEQVRNATNDANKNIDKDIDPDLRDQLDKLNSNSNSSSSRSQTPNSSANYETPGGFDDDDPGF